MPRRKRTTEENTSSDEEFHSKKISKKPSPIEDDSDESQIFEDYEDGKYDKLMNEDEYKGMTELEKEKLLEQKQAKEDQDNYMKSLKARVLKATKQSSEDKEESIQVQKKNSTRLRESEEVEKSSSHLIEEEEDSIPLSMMELQSLCLTRKELLQMSIEPYFIDYCKNMFVRLVAGRNSQTKEILYRICPILEVIISKKTYIVDGIYSNILLKLEWGPLIKDWELLYISNGPITPSEYTNYIQIMKEYERKILNPEEVKERLKSKKLLKTQQYNEQEIQKTVQRNMETIDLSRINIVALKSELETSILLLKHQNQEKLNLIEELKNQTVVDTYTVSQYEQEVQENEEKIQRFEEKLFRVVEEEKRRLIVSQRRLELKKNITLKHRQMNAQALLQAQERESKDIHNAFRRIQTVPAINYAGFKEKEVKEEEVKEIEKDLEEEKNHQEEKEKSTRALSKNDLLPSLEDLHDFNLEIDFSTMNSEIHNSYIHVPRIEESQRKGMSLDEYLSKINSRD